MTTQHNPALEDEAPSIFDYREHLPQSAIEIADVIGAATNATP